MKLQDSLEIQNMIAGVESSRVEFKETTGQLERAMETLCAFLNGEGGTVFFGVTDKGKVIGQEVVDKTKRDIAEAISRLEPAAVVRVRYLEIPNTQKTVIALHVEEDRFNKPFFYKGRAYCRIESVTTVMTREQINKQLLGRNEFKYTWDAYPNDRLRLTDLDENEILKSVRLGVECGRLPETIGNDIPVIMEKFGLMENHVLNNAAAVLFAKDRLTAYPQCLLRLACFRGTDKTEFVDSVRLYGNIFRLLDAAMAFLFKHLSLSGTTERLEREENLTIPYKALRECVVNALCHRLYRNPEESVSIGIYADRVEVVNPGVLPGGWSLRKFLSDHESKPMNPIIADVLYKRKVLENWGRGIQLMRTECEAASLPTPEFIIDSGEVHTIFRFHIDENEKDPNLDGKDPKLVEKDPHLDDEGDPKLVGKDPKFGEKAPNLFEEDPKSDDKSISRKSKKRSSKLLDFLQKMGDEYCSIRVLQQKMGLKDKKGFYRRYIVPSIERGLIEQLYPDTPNHPKQQYRITDNGRNLLSQQEN